MNAYATAHAFIMWTFYSLAVLCVLVLLTFLVAWFWDRWCRRHTHPDRAPIERRPEPDQPTRHADDFRTHFTRHRAQP